MNDDRPNDDDQGPGGRDGGSEPGAGATGGGDDGGESTTIADAGGSTTIADAPRYGGVDPETSRRRALGAGLGLLVVVLSYGPSRLGDADRWWAAGLTVLVAVVLSDSLVDLRALLPTPGVAPASIVVALVAVYLCVPETDQVAIAALVPLVVVGLELVGRGQVGLEWYAVAAASVGWAAMFGASGRQSALVGALFAWWAVLLVPLVHRVRAMPDERSAVATAVIGGLAAIVMARTGGIADSGTTAVVVAAALALVSFGLALAVVVALSVDER